MMKRMKMSILIAILCLSSIALADPNVSYPLSSVSIEITGLEGAEHWIWWEGEEATLCSFAYDCEPGNTANEEVSGRADGAWVNNYIRYDGYEGGFVEYDIHVPAAMTNPTLVARYNAEIRVQTWEVSVDNHNEVLGTYQLQKTNQSNGGTEWAIATLGKPLSVGEHTLRATLQTSGGGSIGSYDGFYLYDGDSAFPVGDDGDGVCYTYITNTRWMAPPTSAEPNMVPVLSDAVKPVVLFNGRDNHERFDITLNGEPFVNGTVIDEPGVYELVVSVSSIPYFRGAYAGANFRVGTTSTCGDPGHPYPPADLTTDCLVDFNDLAVLAANWLDCTDPEAPCTSVP